MGQSPTLSNTILDNLIMRKHSRSDLLRRLRARDRVEISDLRTSMYNKLLDLNYESMLNEKLLKNYINPPVSMEHIALIPDGNRRWAESHNMSIGEGYYVGSKKLEQFRKWCFIDNDIDVATCFTLSTENIERRPPEQLKQLYGVFMEFFNKVPETDAVHEHEIRHEVRGSPGSYEKLPKQVRDSIDNMEKATEDYDEHVVVFLMPYGSRDDIVRAAKKIEKSPLTKAVVTDKGEDETDFRENMMLGDLPDVDLMLRTSEKRISNFMLYENAYSELVFFDQMWPDFQESDFYEALYKYSNRDRRYGV